MRILYVSHNGIGSPVVRSQVLPYLTHLAGAHDIRLVTFERGEPFPEGEFPRSRWTGLSPRAGASLIAKIVDIALGVIRVIAIARKHRAEILHARSHVAASICRIAGLILRRPFVFDMRGFMPEEYADAGLWSRGDIRYRIARAAELHLLRTAAEIVVLTEAAARRLRDDEHFRGSVAHRPITVIPCAVDLERFRPAVPVPPPTLVYSGSLGMWYLLDDMLEVYARARASEPSLRLLVLNRGEHELIAAALARHGLEGPMVEVRSADLTEMPALLARSHVAIALLRRVPSKIGSSPIKVAEYLACGLPVVVSAGLGDTDDQVRRSGAGHVMTSFDESAYSEAGLAVVRLARDAGARATARALAEAVFDLRAGAASYDVIYRRMGPR